MERDKFMSPMDAKKFGLIDMVLNSNEDEGEVESAVKT